MNLVASSAAVPPVSWKEVSSDPMARASLLAWAREHLDETKLGTLQDTLRQCATNPGVDIQSALEGILGVPLPDETDTPAPQPAPAAIGVTRRTPEFSAPAPQVSPVQKPAPAPAPNEALEKIKAEIEELKQKAPANAFLSGLSSAATEAEQTYAAAVKKALTYTGTDAKALQAIRDEIEAAIGAMNGGAPKPSEPVAQKSVPTPAPAVASPLTPIREDPRKTKTPIASRPVAQEPEEEAKPAPAPEKVERKEDTEPVSVPRWGSEVAEEIAETPRTPVPPPVRPTPVVQRGPEAPRRVDRYREPINDAPPPAFETAPEKPVVTPKEEPKEVPAEEPRAVPIRVSNEPKAAPPEVAPQKLDVPPQTPPPAPIEAPAPKLPEIDQRLMSTEVTKGLDQLLHEWAPFEKSGLFGMGGAAGIEHPLYKQLAPLPVAKVLAGDWPKADQKTLAAITEYIEGWGTEQISPKEGEVFEMYLRRVVAHIMDRSAAPK